MSDYQKPYHILLDAAERAIQQLDAVNVGAAREILGRGEQEAEKAYVDGGETGKECVSSQS